MVNKSRAEVEVKGASGKTYVMRFGSGALCQLEEALGVDVMEMAESFSKGKVKFTVIREFVKSGVLGDESVSNDAAHDIIDDVGVLPLIKAITSSLMLTFNVDTETSKDAANPSRPARVKAAAGSGSSSGPQKLAS